MGENLSQLYPYTYASLLKSCTKLKDIEIGSRLHKKTNEIGLLKSNPYVGTAAIDMYAKCGMLAQAKELLHELQVYDSVSWNALISGYLQNDHSGEAFSCFDMMLQRSVLPNASTVTNALKACGNLQAINKGRQLHSQMINSSSLESSQFVGNALVDMYSRCGMLESAREVFQSLPARNIVTWNALISGLIREGCYQEALKTFRLMQSGDICPDGVTFTCVLKACGCLRASEEGKNIHNEIDKLRLLRTDQIVGNSLIDMYSKCEMLPEAQEVFDSLQIRDVVSWSTLIGAYVQHEHYKEALLYYEKMQLQGVPPNEVTYVHVLKACGFLCAIRKGQEIHDEIDKKGIWKANQVVGNALIDMYSKLGLLQRAQEVFEAIPSSNVVTWNTLISCYVEHGFGNEALNLFKQMQGRHIPPNEVTYACIFKACGLVRALYEGQVFHAEVDNNGILQNNLVVGNALLDMYIKCRDLMQAQEAFNKFLHHDTISWNILIAGYLQDENAEEAFSLCELMLSQSIPMDATTITGCLKACGIVGSTEKCKIWHCRVHGLLNTNQLIGNALVDMYFKCGMLSNAQKAFELLPTRNIVTWTTLITGYAQLGEDAAVMCIFERMREEGVRPNSVTFLSILSACCNSGLVDQGKLYFRAMNEDYNIIPTFEHDVCMVDLFGRVGQLERAIIYICESSPHPHIMMWLTLLGACRKWGNVIIGKQAFEQTLLLDSKETSAYLCMYNIYMDAGMFADAKEVDAMRIRAKCSYGG
ncbi:hypothetical protein KP509_10G048100 [Ceratopteris richardii]|nr:hypothetical protein KP509_10G048100 [Ceratopteris richardii]